MLKKFFVYISSDGDYTRQSPYLLKKFNIYHGAFLSYNYRWCNNKKEINTLRVQIGKCLAIKVTNYLRLLIKCSTNVCHTNVCQSTFINNEIGFKDNLMAYPLIHRRLWFRP